MRVFGLFTSVIFISAALHSTQSIAQSPYVKPTPQRYQTPSYKPPVYKPPITKPPVLNYPTTKQAPKITTPNYSPNLFTQSKVGVHNGIIYTCIPKLSMYGESPNINAIAIKNTALISQMNEDIRHKATNATYSDTSKKLFKEIEEKYIQHINETGDDDFIITGLLNDKVETLKAFQTCAETLGIENFTPSAINGAINARLIRAQNKIYDYFLPFSFGTLRPFEARTAIQRLEKINEIPELSQSLNEKYSDFPAIKSRLEITKIQLSGEFTKARRENKDYSPFECYLEKSDAAPRQRIDVGDFYPTEALSKEKDGQITARVQIDEMGNASNAEFLILSDPAFNDEIILKALNRLKFFPKITGCITENSTHTFTMKFLLN